MRACMICYVSQSKFYLVCFVVSALKITPVHIFSVFLHTLFMLFKYGENDFVYEVLWPANVQQKESSFDECLQSQWSSALEKGFFRYHLKISNTKVLPGKYSFLTQLNTQRATNRRAPEEIYSLDQPFDSFGFNFTKVKDDEILFEMRKATFDQVPTAEKHYFAINVSPFEFGHSLLLPTLYSCLPQVVTKESLSVAVNVVLLSASPALRVGFNSLCGFASVNHLHYHVYYLRHHMLLETMKVQHLAGPCHVLTDYPAPGFVFQLPEDHSVDTLVSSVFKLANFLQVHNIAHNLYFTRGRSFDCDKAEDVRDTVRVFVWARRSSSGAKESAMFNPAMCELFGHLSIRTEEAYNNVTEQQVSEILSDLCHDTFSSIQQDVCSLFK